MSWTLGHVLTTLFGAAMFPFLIGTIWGKLVEEGKSAGAIFAGFWIVGTVWLMNHGIGLIYQPQMANSGPWSDMALTAFWGLFFADILRGKKINWAAFGAGILGGILGGLVLAVLVPAI